MTVSGPQSRESARRILIAIQASILVGALVLAIAPIPRAGLEHVYSQRVYLTVQRHVTTASNVLPISLFDVALPAAVSLLIAWWVVGLRRAPGRRGPAVLRLAMGTLTAGAVIYLVFLAMWGLNYRREPLRDKLDFDAARLTDTQLQELASHAVTQLNALHPFTSATWPDFDTIVDRLALPFEQAQREIGASLTALPARPKRTWLGGFFRQSATDGMTNPFFLEVLVNDAVLPFERPFLVAHEWAHLAGYADESEANFLGWLTCLRGDEQARYSGWLFLYSHLLRSLRPEDRSALHAELGEGPRADLRAVSQRVRGSSPTVRRSTQLVYDRFLKANRVEAGVESYHEVVALILGTRFDDDWVPARRLRGD